MRVIDDDGDLFGLVNVIDALAALLVLALLIAGFAFLTGSSVGETTTEVTFDSKVTDYIANATLSGDARLRGMTLVEGPVREDSWYNETRRERVSRIRFTALVDAEVRGGRVYLGNERLYVGGSVSVDFNVTQFRATVVDLEVRSG